MSKRLAIGLTYDTLAGNSELEVRGADNPLLNGCQVSPIRTADSGIPILGLLP